MKSLDQWQQEMSVLFDAVRDGTTELKTASELANIAGKALKAEQLKLAREVFASGRAHGINGNAALEDGTRAVREVAAIS